MSRLTSLMGLLTLLCTALLTFAADTDVEMLGQQWLTPGIYTFENRSIPDGMTGIGVVVNREGFTDPTARLTFTLKASFDGGQSWEPPQGSTTDGGVFLNRLGNPQETSRFQVPVALGIGRLVTVVIEVSGNIAQIGAFLRFTEP